MPFIDLRGDQGGAFATFMFAQHLIAAVKKPIDILIIAETGI